MCGCVGAVCGCVGAVCGFRCVRLALAALQGCNACSAPSASEPAVSAAVQPLHADTCRRRQPTMLSCCCLEPRVRALQARCSGPVNLLGRLRWRLVVDGWVRGLRAAGWGDGASVRGHHWCLSLVFVLIQHGLRRESDRVSMNFTALVRACPHAWPPELDRAFDCGWPSSILEMSTRVAFWD